MHFGFVRHERREDPTEPQRVLTECRTHPVVARGRGVALVEHQVDDFEHRREPWRQLGAARHLEGHALLRQRALGPHDALRNRRLRDEERASNLDGGQSAEEAKGERDASLGGQNRMAGREHQPQQVVAHIVIESCGEVRHGGLLGIELTPEHFVLAREQLGATKIVDRPMLGGRHQPGARVSRHAGLGPLLQRRHQRIVRKILGHADVPDNAGQAGDEPRRFDPPDRVDRAVCIGSRHRLPITSQSERPVVLGPESVDIGADQGQRRRPEDQGRGPGLMSRSLLLQLFPPRLFARRLFWRKHFGREIGRLEI